MKLEIKFIINYLLKYSHNIHKNITLPATIKMILIAHLCPFERFEDHVTVDPINKKARKNRKNIR